MTDTTTGLKPAERDALLGLADSQPPQIASRRDANTLIAALEELGGRRLLSGPATEHLAPGARCDAVLELLDSELEYARHTPAGEVDAIGIQALAEAARALQHLTDVEHDVARVAGLEVKLDATRRELAASAGALDDLRRLANAAVDAVQGAEGLTPDHFAGVLEPLYRALQELAEELGR